MSGQPRRPAGGARGEPDAEDRGRRDGEPLRPGDDADRDTSGGEPLRVWDVTGSGWLGLVGESLYRDALATVVAPFPDRTCLTWAVLLPTIGASPTTGREATAVLAAIRGRVVGWLPAEESERAGGLFRSGVGAACCPALVTRTPRGDWVVDLRIDRAVLDGSAAPQHAVPISALHAA